MQPLLPGRTEPSTQRSAVATLAVVGCVAVATFAYTQSGPAQTSLFTAPATQVAQGTRVVGAYPSAHISRQAHSGRSYDVEGYSMPSVQAQERMTFQPAPASSVHPAMMAVGAIGAFVLGFVAMARGLATKATAPAVQPIAMASWGGPSSILDGERGEYAGVVFPWWEDPGYQAETIPQFPDAGVASPEQARILWHFDGYEILDVRTAHEREDRGRIRIEKGDVHIPLITGPWKWNAELQKKAYEQTLNKDFINQVHARFPDKNQKLIIMCSDGTNRALQVLELLYDDGYENIVGLRGGYNNWDRAFDPKGGRRDVGQATEVFDHVDSEGNTIAGCGVHATGAGFEMMDSVLYDLPPVQDTTEWLEWDLAPAAPSYDAAPEPVASSYGGYEAPAAAPTGSPDLKRDNDDAWNSW